MSFLSKHNRGMKQKYLRKRIIEIAASYVGQKMINPSTYQGFQDPKFEERIKGVGWRQNAWCNYTVRLIYKEALTTGNAYIGPSAIDYNTWGNTGDGFYLVPPVDIKGGTVLEKWPAAQVWRKSAQTSYVEYTRKNYQAANRYISITNNQNFDKSIKGVKNQGVASKAKAAITGNYVLPGDFVTFDKGKDGGPNNTARFNNHIGLYICPGSSDCSIITCIEGNYSAGLFVVNRPVTDINGFGQLMTRKNP